MAAAAGGGAARRPWGLPAGAAEALGGAVGAGAAGPGPGPGPGRRRPRGAAAAGAAAALLAAALAFWRRRRRRGRGRVVEVRGLQALVEAAGAPSAGAVALVIAAADPPAGHLALFRWAARAAKSPAVACLLCRVDPGPAGGARRAEASPASPWRERLAGGMELAGAFVASLVTPDAAAAEPSGDAFLREAWRRVERGGGAGASACAYAAVREGVLVEGLAPSRGEAGCREAEAFLRRHLLGGGGGGRPGGQADVGGHGAGPRRRHRAPEGSKGFRAVQRRPGCGASGS